MRKFKFIPRGFEETLVLLPGWACDWRMFSHLELDCNYVFALNDNATSMDIAEFLESQNISEVSILGFSMGSFIAADFVFHYSQMVKRLFLVSTTIKPDSHAMANIKATVKANHKAFLYRFYLGCFAKSDAAALALFRQELIDDYLKNINKDDLLRGLDYLAHVSLSLEGINRAKQVIVYHGGDDKVFPVKQIMAVKDFCPHVDIRVIQGAGHALLFHHAFLDDIRGIWKSQ
jgi:pimeloyl-ACP methyl ester carboxylesterase